MQFAQEEGATVGPVYAMYYPKAGVRVALIEFSCCGRSQEKEESWWLVIGGPKSALAVGSAAEKGSYGHYALC